MSRRFLASAMASAPVAPIAPPSVGVATPRKIVPSTRKIRPSGGISTKVTRSAICDSRPSLRKRFGERQDEGEADADAHRGDDELVGRHCCGPRVFAKAAARRRPRARRRRQRAQAGRAVGLADGARFLRQGRRPGRADEGDGDHVEDVEAGQREAGDEGALVQVADAAPELVGQDDQHQRRRDDLRQRARSGDDAARDAPVVAVAQHDRQRDQAHRDHRRGDHAGGGGEHRADQDHGERQAAAHRAEQLADGVEQVLGHAGALEDQAHEGEEGNRQQRLVLHRCRTCAAAAPASARPCPARRC